MYAKLREKIKTSPSLIFLYLMVLIPVLTMCYFLVMDYSQLQQEEIRKNEQMAAVLAENLDSYLENVKNILAAVSNLPDVQNKDRLKIEAIFQSLKLTDDQIGMYWAADNDCNVIAMYPERRTNGHNPDFIKELLQNPSFVSEPHTGASSGVKVITISTLIKDKNGRTKGVIVASIPLENLRKKLQMKVGRTGYPILVTKSGKFLVHPQREIINKKIGPDDPITKTIQKGGSGTLHVVAAFDNQEKFFSYVPLKQADWIVLVIQPVSEFHTQTWSFFTRNAVIVVLILFLVVLAAYCLVIFRKREEAARILQAEKLSVVGQLAAGMAHEIRNPMTSIKGFAQLAATSEKGLTADQINIIINEADRIESIIRETMLLAKPVHIEFKPVDLEKLLREIEILMQPQLSPKHAQLTVQVEKDIPLIVGEPNHLKQVFINLIKNSIEALPDYGGHVLVHVKRTNHSIVITTHDNGCGIPPDIQKRLGDPFVSSKETGTGLGLTVSYRIIQNHGGKISVQSDPQNGTTFTIELPLDRTANP